VTKVFGVPFVVILRFRVSDALIIARFRRFIVWIQGGAK